jgi:DNA mismatch repair protein MSH5
MLHIEVAQNSFILTRGYIHDRTRMSSLRRRRASVFSTSYRPPRTTSHFPLERGDEVRFPQYEYQSSTGFTAPRRSEVDIDQISYESRHRRQNDEQSFSDDDDEQVIMAVDIKERGTVGCCYYVAQEEKLYILCDVQSGGKEIIELCKRNLYQKVVVTNS